jgi:hydrogenase-4 component F
MAPAVSGAWPLLIIALPFVSAAALSVIGSWRFGVRINLGSACLLFVLAAALPWRPHSASTLLHAGAAEMHLVLLVGFIAMTTAWFSWREVPASLVARSIDRRRARLYHAACQALIGGIMLALLADSPVLTWFGLGVATGAAAAVTGAVHGSAAAVATSRLLQLCGVGLMLALFGTLLLYLASVPHAAALRWSTLAALSGHAAGLASIILLLGYGAAASVVPLHAWLPDAATEGVAPGAILVSVLMVNAPLLVFMRLRSTVPDLTDGLLIAFGLASLLLGGALLLTKPDLRRTVAFAGMALIGIVVFGIGVGGSAALPAAWVISTLLALGRASALQCDGLPAGRFAAWTSSACVLLLALLPLLGLLLLAGPTADRSAWLLLPLGAGALATSWALLAQVPIATRPGDSKALSALAPIWLQLVLAVVLALLMPGAVTDWFHAMATAR